MTVEITQPLVGWGNLWRTKKLPPPDKVLAPQPAVRPATKKESPSWAQPVVEVIQRFNSWVRENITGALEKIEKKRVRRQYIFTVNVFLRHVPVEERAKFVDSIMDITSMSTPFSPTAEGAAGTYFKHWIRALSYLKLTETKSSLEVVHEVIHVLQDLGAMPLNYALTHATTHLLDCIRNHKAVIETDRSYGDVLQRFGTREAWFHLVKTGRTDDGLKIGLRIGEQPDLKLYVENEDYFDREFAAFGERIGNRKGLKDPYDVSLNVGRNRAARAYLIGFFSGNIDNAFTLLWLHSLGHDFDKCERAMVEHIEAGTVNQFYEQYEELREESETKRGKRRH